MAIKPSLFKAYDIRGLSPGEIDADMAYRVGQAVVKFTEAATVVVGRDMRGTTPELFDALAKGIMSLGADVVDVGMVTTPMFYYAVGEYELHDAGVMVTASHNPSEYNGFKLCFGDVLPIGGSSGMEVVRELAMAGPYPEAKQGKMVQTSVQASYLDRLFSVVGASEIGPLSVVVDAANGMGGVVISDIFARLPQCRFQGMFLEPDGTFPNHEANPLKEETLDALKAVIADTHADIGVAFDGDADRVGLVDETGTNVPGDLIMALLAPEILAKEPGTVLYDVRCSQVVKEEVERAGGKAVMAPVGHGLIKPLMRNENAVFAGELSNHFYFRDFYGAESSDLIMLLTLALMTRTGKKLSELVAPLRRYHHSGEINFRVADAKEAMQRVKETYAPEASAISEIDGVRMEFSATGGQGGDWWFSVRASNTEPLLRLNLEAKERGVMEAKREELSAMLQ